MSVLTFRDVFAMETAKRAVEIALAGDLSLLLVGPAGSGKTHLITAAAELAIEIGDWHVKEFGLTMFCEERPSSDGGPQPFRAQTAHITVRVEPITAADAFAPPRAEFNDVIGARILAARALLKAAFPHGFPRWRDMLPLLAEPARRLGQQAYQAMGLTVGDIERCAQVALTISALETQAGWAPAISRVHLAEALSYRLHRPTEGAL